MVGFAEAPGLLRSASSAEGHLFVAQGEQKLMGLTGGAAGYWCAPAWSKGLRHLTTGQTRQRTLIYLATRAFGAAQSGTAAAGKAGYGTVRTERNRLAWQQIQGRLNPTT